MYVLLDDMSNNTTITFQPQGATWDENYYMIEPSIAFSITYTPNAPILYMGCDRMGSETGDECVKSSHPNGYGIFPFGMFTVSSSEDPGGDYSFKLNMIDSDYPYSGSSTGPTNDFAIKNGGSNFYWETGGQTDPQNVTNQIDNQGFPEVTLWQLCGKYVQSSNLLPFEPSTPENLIYINVNNNPEISWDASEPYNGGVTYTLYRKDPGETEFSVIATNLTVTHYLDSEVEICCGNTLVTYRYKVIATSGDGSKDSDESDPLNVKAKTGEGINTNMKELAEILPESYSLDRSFPNPFNPETTIKYNLPERSQVQLTIFDLLGRKINTLINQTEYADYYSMKWDGTDESGQPLSSGVYIIHFSAQSIESKEIFTQSQKVVLLK